MKILIPIFILIFAFSISAQVKKPTLVVEAKPTQKVIVEKTNGGTVSGLFAGGSVDSITIDSDGNKITLKLSDISLLRFVSNSLLDEPPVLPAPTTAPLPESPFSTTPIHPRKYIRDSRGRCYFINSKGNKTYVKKSLCN